MEKDKLRKVESVRVTRSGMMVISWSSKEQKEKALWLYKRSMYEVESCDFQSRAPKKGVISLDIEASWYRDNIPGIVGARRLIFIVNGKKEENLSVR
jgi:hypothetical protein